jgi:hypothetical protein
MSYPSNLDPIEKVFWYIEQLGGVASLSVLQALIAGGSPGFPTYAGDPNTHVTASQAGEMVFDTVDHIMYVSTAADATHWIALVTSGTNMNLSGNLDVSGTSALDGLVTLLAGIAVTGGVATDTLDVSGASALDGLVTLLAGLAVTGGTSTDTLDVSGASALDGLVTLLAGIAVTGGAATDTLDVSGTSALDGDVTTLGAVNVGTTLDVSGTATLDGAVVTGSTLDVGTDLEVAGKSGFNGTEPVAAQAITGALSTVIDAPAKAVLTSIIAAAVATGLCTDATS